MDSIDELDMYEAEKRMALYNEYRDAARVFEYYVETELRAYLANEVEVMAGAGGSIQGSRPETINSRMPPMEWVTKWIFTAPARVHCSTASGRIFCESCSMVWLREG